MEESRHAMTRPRLDYPRIPYHELLGRAAERAPDRWAIVFQDRRITFRELEGLSNSLAGGLAALGVGKGDRVALFMSNRPEYLVSFEAVSKLVGLHLRFHGYGSGEWTDSAVRRYVRDAGDQLDRLHVLTRADCTTRNRRKAERLRRAYDELEARIARLAEAEELAAIRPDLDGNQIMQILGIGRTKAYELAKTGEFPVRVLRIGRRYVVPVPAILALLGAGAS